jgi:hypothetical protein
MVGHSARDEAFHNHNRFVTLRPRTAVNSTAPLLNQPAGVQGNGWDDFRYCGVFQVEDVGVQVEDVGDDTRTSNTLENTEDHPRILSQGAADDDLPPPNCRHTPTSPSSGWQIGGGGGSHDSLSSLHAALSTKLQTCEDALQAKTAALQAKEEEFNNMAGVHAFLKKGYQAKDAQMQHLKRDMTHRCDRRT